MEMHCCFRFIVLFGFITGAREGPNYSRSNRTSLEGASAPSSWFFVARLLVGVKHIDAPAGSFLRVPAGVTHDFENNTGLVRRDAVKPQQGTTRDISAPKFSRRLSRMCPNSLALIVKNAQLSAESVEGGGQKNRYRVERKSRIAQVLTSRTLSVCGEVAERLKAAVC
jgi:hypothetical protein